MSTNVISKFKHLILITGETDSTKDPPAHRRRVQNTQGRLKDWHTLRTTLFILLFSYLLWLLLSLLLLRHFSSIADGSEDTVFSEILWLIVTVLVPVSRQSSHLFTAACFSLSKWATGLSDAAWRRRVCAFKTSRSFRLITHEGRHS